MKEFYEREIAILKQRQDIANAMALLFAVLLCLFACVFSITTGLTWATIPFGFAFVFILCIAIRYLAYAFNYAIPNSEDMQEDIQEFEDDYLPEPTTIQQAIQIPAKPSLPQEEIKARQGLYTFVYGVTVRKLISERSWQNLPKDDPMNHFTLNEYRALIKALEDWGIVSKPSRENNKRNILMDFNAALKTICYVKRDKDFWEVAGCGNHTSINYPNNYTPIEHY